MNEKKTGRELDSHRRTDAVVIARAEWIFVLIRVCVGSNGKAKGKRPSETKHHMTNVIYVFWSIHICCRTNMSTTHTPVPGTAQSIRSSHIRILWYDDDDGKSNCPTLLCEEKKKDEELNISYLCGVCVCVTDRLTDVGRMLFTSDISHNYYNDDIGI